MKRVTIKSIPLQYHSYYQWLLLGLYELENNGEISLRFRLPFYQFVYLFIFNDYLRRESYRFLTKYKLLKSESYVLTGYILNSGGGSHTFAFDIADSPFAFDIKSLQTADVYFKVQCPKTIDEKGFRLTSKVFIPYAKEVLNNNKKIKPAMLGPRRLAWSFKYSSLKKSYDEYVTHQSREKKKLLMCYFGGAKGPSIKSVAVSAGNFDGEDIIMSRFTNELNHPNEKRYKLFRIIRKMGENCDARVINKDGVKDDEIFLKKDAVIPLKDFTSHIADFKYNANISGFRLSIPNRFIESFMAGTAIVTDQLSVKWYKDFEEEVVELPAMGYLPMEEVDWNSVQQQLQNLPDVPAEKVIEQFNKNWAPIPFARYIVSAII